MGAVETLKTAKLGYDVLTKQSPELRLCGLRNLVVFGRAVTFVLQNLRNTEPEFDEWYSEFAQEMKSDPLLTYFKELRNILEKEGDLKLSTRVHLYNRSLRFR
jgi:cyclopropane fatty-acyl-phospholipid synthase-like methyltransferase